ncbi:hypothetical protein/serine 3-dehydrogenase [Granulicella rosea]|uniref:NADP-dependent 3-hydroxy acid dehydrogenase YdfG n=1 Tax=Granulicella rosea TaxID=474952 RepID=A0A239CRN7_9BACT|nr:SDR family NAD(P)-dependent oxidoreductase [Granulicella rosea]SNS22790.1 hypothetical protein/serine 3-dehydrogenase [Granulicella rosea]
MESLRGKIVLITGASSGIGKATAYAFAARGAKLVLCARRLELLDGEVDGLTSAGAEGVLNVQLDVQDRAAVEAALAGLPEEWKAIDVLVNNAGLSRGLTKIYEDDPQNWEEMIDTNVKGLLYMTRYVVPGMVERGAGQVINLGSTAGHWTYANGGVYCATKAAVNVITEGLKIDLIGTPVRVTSVDPGMVETDFSKIRFRGDEERAAKVYAGLKPLEPSDVADAIVYAASVPKHVNISNILLMPTDQSNSTTFNRK